MSFHDDSQILSQLGILDSHERSPKRETTQAETKKFVDVKLVTSVSDSEDDDDNEDLVFDRNNLLSSSKRQHASLVRGRADNHTIRFIVLAILFLTAGLVSTSTSLLECSVRHEVIASLWTFIGMFCGAYTSKVTASRSNLMLFMLCTLLTLLVNLFLAFNFAFVYAVRGFFVGATLYGGLLIWFAFWRRQPRKLLVFLFLFSAGGLLSMTVKTAAFNEATSNLADMSIVTRSVQETVSRLKRAADVEDTSKILLPFVADVDNSTLAANITEEAAVKKPEVATGTVQKSKTKTEMNAEKEQEVEEKKNDLDVLAVNGSTPATILETTTTTSTTTTTPTTTTSTTTTTSSPAPTTTEIITVDVKTRDSKENERSPSTSIETSPPYPPNCPSDSLFLSGSHSATEEAASAFVKTFVIFSVVVYFFAYALCCLPCGLKPDSKVKKLESDSVVGLGMRLRILIAAIQTILGFLQQVKHFNISASPSSTSDHIFICSFAVITSSVIVFLGRRIASLESVIISFILAALGEIILLFSATSQLGHIISICGLYALWISLFLVVEIFLHVRATVQLAYFLIAWIVGRAIACIFALESVFSGLEHVATFLFTVAIGILLYHAVRMLQKSKRLKEILDNSSAPISAGIAPEAEGEYISLTAQDVLDDDDLLDEEEMDRSSMDLDYELEQLGLEPVGSGSRA